MHEPRIERIDAGRARLAGRFGFHEAAAVAGRWREFAGDGGDVELDISGLQQVDSATLAVLLDWAARLRRAGAHLHLTGAPAGLVALAHLSDTESLLGLSSG
ncbi:MAG TPA: STAS domain-containing protein [Dokdonella sp.]|nr:STAS domain-containing protein [Dokdonella sp.]